MRSEKHRRFIASLPCCVSLQEGATQAAHIRAGFFCLSRKPSDDLCVPLSWIQHQKQHQYGETKFWEPFGGIEKAKRLAKDLFTVTGDEESARELIARFRT